MAGHDHSHHSHRHGPGAPHPAQPAPWSILRMGLTARVAAAVAISAVLWVTVWAAIVR